MAHTHTSNVSGPSSQIFDSKSFHLNSVRANGKTAFNKCETMNIGITVPCHIDDLPIFKYCLHSLQNLNPQPDRVLINVNEGEKSMKQLLTEMYDQLFDYGCDVIVKCSADFYLFPHILNHVDENQVVTFMPLFKRLVDITYFLHHIFLRHRTWNACYSLPKRVWSNIKHEFDGTDTSISRAVKNWKVEGYQFYPLRPWTKQHTKRLLNTFPLWKRLLWQLIRVKAV